MGGCLFTWFEDSSHFLSGPTEGQRVAYHLIGLPKQVQGPRNLGGESLGSGNTVMSIKLLPNSDGKMGPAHVRVGLMFTSFSSGHVNGVWKPPELAHVLVDV